MSTIEQVRQFLLSRGLPGADSLRQDGTDVSWGRLTLVDYGDFFAVQDPLATSDAVGDSPVEALEEYFG